MGKTTTAVNAAACVAEAGYDTLLVDVDPQCNATVGLGLAKDLEPNVYDVLAGEATLRRPSATRHPRSRDRPVDARTSPAPPSSCPRLEDSRDAAARRPRPGARPLRLHVPRLPAVARPPDRRRARRGRPRASSPCRPSTTRSRVWPACSTRVRMIQRGANPRLSLAGMVLTMHDGRTRLARDVEREVREHFPELVFDTVDPAQRPHRGGAELRPPRDPSRPALRRRRGLLRARQGGGRPWLDRAHRSAPRHGPRPRRDPERSATPAARRRDLRDAPARR